MCKSGPDAASHIITQQAIECQLRFEVMIEGTGRHARFSSNTIKSIAS
jgi:hypothetical protein